MEKLCPLLNKPCIEHQCKFYVHLLGNNPQTGSPEDRFDCTFAFLLILLIENSQQQRQTGASVESLRNENVKSAQILASVLLNTRTQTQIPAKFQAQPRSQALHSDFYATPVDPVTDVDGGGNGGVNER